MSGSWSAAAGCATGPLQIRIAGAPAEPVLAALLCGLAFGAFCSACCARGGGPLAALAAARRRGDRTRLRDEEHGGSEGLSREKVCQEDLPREAAARNGAVPEMEPEPGAAERP